MGFLSSLFFDFFFLSPSSDSDDDVLFRIDSHEITPNQYSKLVGDKIVLDTYIDPLNRMRTSEVPFAGLMNYGSLCYINSLLQTLFMLPCFRKLVFSFQPNFAPLPETPPVSGKLCR